MYTTGKTPTPNESQDALLARLKELYDEIGKDTEGIAVSMPGMIDSDNGYCRTGGMLVYNQDKYVARQICVDARFILTMTENVPPGQNIRLEVLQVVRMRQHLLSEPVWVAD